MLIPYVLRLSDREQIVSSTFLLCKIICTFTLILYSLVFLPNNTSGVASWKMPDVLYVAKP